MSHVDEGTLHAYLDGALDALPTGEAARVREHLASCDVCAARLEEERALRDEASAILAGAAPGAVDLPPFEELRARARTRAGGAGAGRRMARLGWAASVVLAVGAGWLLRAAAGPDAARQLSSPEAARTVSPPAEAAQGVNPASTEAAGGASGADVELGERLAEVAPETARRAEATEERADRTVEARVAPLAEADSGSVRPAATTVSAAAGREALADVAPTPPILPESPLDAVLTGVARLDTLTFPRTAAEAKEAVAAAPTREKEAVKPKVAANRVAPQPAAPAAQDLRARQEAPSPVVQAAQRTDLPSLSAGMRSTSLSVPGLQVLSVTGLEGEGMAGAVRVRQLMADGDTLELVKLPPGSDPSALAPVVGGGRTELVLPRDGGWLVVRARASREALQELVRRMDGGG